MLPAVRKGHEDWYLVKNFLSLGTLNEGAVSAAAAKTTRDGARFALHGNYISRGLGRTEMYLPDLESRFDSVGQSSGSLSVCP